ncbi:wax ester/triacylglycerol synthase family O-acyltransferase [Longispora sp. K20-0274]|uniref:wax ester/triacylglycerol synthase domain-containing protein n=1 Tax=Longispora sp. K20-0274 TaxID=3088255 RepID=UPI00399B5AC5
MGSGRLDAVDALFVAAGRAQAQFCVVVRLRGPRPTREELVALVDERWGSADRLRLCLRGARRPRWHPGGAGSWRRQIETRSWPGGGTEPAAIAAILDTPLPDELPRWRLVLLTGPEDETWSLVLVVHHALLDGLSARGLLVRLLAAPTTADPVPTVGTPPRPAGALATLWHGLRAVARRPAAHRPLSRRHLALARVPLRALRHPSATVNDVFLAAVTGALGGAGERWSRVLVPVSVRTDASLGNHVLPLEIRLPWAAADPERRLAAIGRLTAPPIRADAVARAGRALGWSGRVGWPAVRLAESTAMSRNAMTCSSMRPLPAGLGLGRARVVEAYFTTVHRRGLAIALTGFAEDMAVSVVADAALAGFADRLAAGIAEQLTRAVTGPVTTP